MSDPKHVFVTYIKSTKEKVWNAITRPESTIHYFFGTRIRSTLKPGEPIEYVLTQDGKEELPVVGKILRVIPNSELSHTFYYHGTKEAPSMVTYRIEEADTAIRLTVIHDGFKSETDTYHSVKEGWPFILSGLKSFLETGSGLN